MSDDPTSTISSCGSILVFSCILQNVDRFFNAVLLLYQSPPPEYLTLPILIGFWLKIELAARNDIINIEHLLICTLQI